MIGPSSICLGGELEAARLRVGRARSTSVRRPPRLAGWPGPSPPWSWPSLRPPWRAGRTRSSRNGSRGRRSLPSPSAQASITGLPVQGAVRPARDLVRHIGAARAELGCQGDEPLVVVPAPGGAGVLDAALRWPGRGRPHAASPPPPPGPQRPAAPPRRIAQGARLGPGRRAPIAQASGGRAAGSPPGCPSGSTRLRLRSRHRARRGGVSWMAAQACSRAAMIRLLCSAMVPGVSHARMPFLLACACQPAVGWRVGAWGGLGAGCCPPANPGPGPQRLRAQGWCPYIAMGGGAGPYAARPPPGTAPSLRRFPSGVAPDVKTGNTDKGTRSRCGRCGPV